MTNKQTNYVYSVLWYFVTKTFPTYWEKKKSRDREKLLKFEAEGREFAKCLR